MSTETTRPKLTTRERRERRADRLNAWADRREAKAETAHAASSAATAGIPFGQPILVGHHSQRRHERAVERGNSAMGRAVEHSRKAASMRSRAANIQAQAEHAIYSDDDDVVERLRSRVAELEGQRDAMKARNADFKREHRADLKALTPYDRSRAVPHPPYEITNLGGNIRRYKQRLTDAEKGAQSWAPPPPSSTRVRAGPRARQCSRSSQPPRSRSPRASALGVVPSAR